MNSGFDENNINIQEGHLGGYIKSSQQLAQSGLDISNGDPATWSPSLWLWAASALNIKSVLDIGCGEGHCAAFFKRYGCDVLGVDGSRLALRDSKIPKQHIRHDFTDGSYVADRQFDMIWCSEFVEHVEEKYSDNFLQTFTYASRFIIMTFAEPGQVGWHHVNCQPQEYWELKLWNIGYRLDNQRTGFARQAAAGGHFQRSGLVFQKI
jgi:SAM-dependent methyltransferase